MLLAALTELESEIPALTSREHDGIDDCVGLDRKPTRIIGPSSPWSYRKNVTSVKSIFSSKLAIALYQYTPFNRINVGYQSRGRPFASRKTVLPFHSSRATWFFLARRIDSRTLGLFIIWWTEKSNTFQNCKYKSAETTANVDLGLYIVLFDASSTEEGNCSPKSSKERKRNPVTWIAVCPSTTPTPFLPFLFPGAFALLFSWSGIHQMSGDSLKGKPNINQQEDKRNRPFRVTAGRKILLLVEPRIAW